MSQLAYLDLQRKYKELVSGKGDISDSDSAWVTKVYFPPPSPSSFQLWRSLPLFTRIVVLWGEDISFLLFFFPFFFSLFFFFFFAL
jgi:hypothetical protein